MSHFLYGFLQHSLNGALWNTDDSFIWSRRQQPTKIHLSKPQWLPGVIQDADYQLLKLRKAQRLFSELPVSSNFYPPHQRLWGRHARVTSMKQCNPVGSRRYAFLIMVPTVKNNLPSEIQMVPILLAFQRTMKTWRFS